MEVSSELDRVDGVVEISILTDNRGSFSTELERNRLDVLAAGRSDDRPDSGRTGEAEFGIGSERQLSVNSVSTMEVKDV